MFCLRITFLLIATLFGNFFERINSTKRISKVGIDSIYSVIDHSENTLFFFENGRVISTKNADILGNIQEYSPQDQLIDFIRIRNESFIILVKQFNSRAVLRKIKVNNLGEINLNWDLELDVSISKFTRKLFYLPGKLLLTIGNHYFVINESNGRILEQFSLSTHKIFLFFHTDEMNKQLTIVYNELKNEIEIYDSIPIDKNLNEYPRREIKIDPEKKILYNSGIITLNGKNRIMNLLFAINESIGLFTYNIDENNKNYFYSKVNMSSFNNICSSIFEELTLRQIKNSEMGITLTKKKYNKGYQIFHIFESNPSYILESFSSINDNVQSSNAMIIQDEENDSRFIVIISYNDLTNILSITTIFNYFTSIRDNKIFRYNLKIEYFNKNNKMVHGPIVNLMYSTNMGLLLQWDDSLLVSISLNCDGTILKCFKPKINGIYEGVISSSADPDYFKNNILFYLNRGNHTYNLGNTINYENSSFINGAHLYNYSNYSKSNLNVMIFGTIMFTINKYFSVFAYNIDNHQIIWRNDSLRQKDHLKLYKKKLFVLRKILPELVIVDQSSILRIEILSGKTISIESYIESSKLIVSTPPFTSNEQNINPLLILLDKHNKTLKFVGLDNKTVNIKDKSYFYFTNESNIIKCYKMISGYDSEVHWQYVFDLDETISVYSTPECSYCKSFPVIVDEKYNIINRFDYPYLLGVITSKKKVLLFNQINGNLIYSSFLPQMFEPPFTLEIFQNIILITSFHSNHKVPVILILELFQFIKEETSTGINMLDKFIFLVSNKKNVKESKIYSEKHVHVQETTFLYNYELPIDYSLLSRTSESLASKIILFGNERSNVLECIPERLFTTLRPNKSKKKNLIHNSNLPFYQSILSERIKFSTKFNSKKIFSFPHETYESKSKLLSVGFNSLEVFEIYPNTSFDLLPYDFNYYNIINTVFLILTITAISIYFSKRNQLKKWI
ncbi:unnamed protein product [Cryptosporidium hominis]|uniref:ER membrane protein complex subunit 1 n=2 Tax=Cryptosporidium hominis TaxID=237895 RepID=A0A0S4TBY4_CRYHO|nr:Protein of unknown function (DUF1620) [Cryptosporidium hominis]PPA62417.1 Protein of unknown function (DUF1620) family protein [Cryptosporidium hominis]PPS95062.1 ER membrane protein complex subunit 1 [Cryptosporidium hominis]CUV04572.1 unnamed protein product [Cryptosporidium hominis]|eukprot:PPS95062.1 ER membrane protein complex subunit 1 [Cryptosporidium hominis]